MSYDIYMNRVVQTCVFEVGNMTSNVSGMWRKALGFGIHEIEGKTGAEVRPDIERAIKNITDPDTRHEYEAMNPKNGWGDVNSAEEYLRQVLEGCIEEPEAKFEVSR